MASLGMAMHDCIAWTGVRAGPGPETAPAAPAAAFSVDIDDLRKALAAVLPVHIESTLKAIGVSLEKGRDNLLVLAHRKVELAHNRAGVEPPVAFRLRLDGAMQGSEARPRACGENEPMELVIEIENVRPIVAAIARDSAQLFVHPLQLFRQLLREFENR